MATQLTDYYALLGLERQFDIDDSKLESSYFNAQREYHPDRFIGKPAEERQKALQQSVDINNAYQTLKSPHNRAIYLLKQQDIEVADSQTAVKPSQELLMEIMEWRENVTEATSPEALKSLQNELESLQSETTSHISEAFKQQDLQAMAQHTMRLGYLTKTSEEIRQKIRQKTMTMNHITSTGDQQANG